MKLFTAKQIQDWDSYTILHEPISSYDLMERAVQSLYAQLTKDYDFAQKTVHLYCGSGNNGGDGLALARYLKQRNTNILIIYVGDIHKASPDNQKNYKIAQDLGIPIIDHHHIADSTTPDYVIDALLGTGLNRSVLLDSELGKVIQHINQLNAYVISIDIPSGLMSDDNRNNTGVWVKADIVYSFQQPKIVFFLKDWAKTIKKWEVIDIGLSKMYYQNTETKYYALTKQVFEQYFKPRTKFTHKGTYGHTLLIGGLYDKTGAGILAAKAAYRSGCGLLTVMSNPKNQTAFNVSIPEAMFYSSKKFMEMKNKHIFLEKFDSIGIGHGLDTDDKSLSMLHNVIEHYHKRLVIDADGINLLSKHEYLWKYLEGKSVVLTPHIREAERLLHQSFSNALDRIEAIQDFAEQKQCIIVLKDAITSIIFSDRTVYFSDNGCSGMAKGGTGDTLTGVLSACMAQDYAVNEAVLVGVYAHSVAAKKAAQVFSNTSLMPSDSINCLFKE